MDFSKNCLLKRHFSPQFNFAWPKSVARTDYKCCGVSKKKDDLHTKRERPPINLNFIFCILQFFELEICSLEPFEG